MIKKIKRFITTILYLIRRLLRFLSYDIWRVNGDEKSSLTIGLYNILKAFILAFRNVNASQLNTRASALTYSALLSIVPLLAVLFAIARGFGFQNIVESQLFSFFEGQEGALTRTMSFIDSSLEYAQGGVFLGVGVLMLLYTVINLLSSIEDNFNHIWRIKTGRTYFRLFTDYLTLIIIIPVFLVCNAGFSIALNSTAEMQIIGLVMTPMMKIIPFVVVVLLFAFLFAYIPNTKVKFSSAIIGGIFTGVCFQVFQMLYIGGQIWISKYNAIYGSFAALPLLLLWMQISWFLTLIGVELCYAYQNVSKFDFDNETQNISRRYKNFILIAIMTLIVKRFEKGEKPYTSDDISEKYKIPTRLTSETLFYLQDLGLIVETPSGEDLVAAYLPAIDINKLSVAYVINKSIQYGSEDFKIDKEDLFKNEWQTILNLEELVDNNKDNKLLKDL